MIFGKTFLVFLFTILLVIIIYANWMNQRLQPGIAGDLKGLVCADQVDWKQYTGVWYENKRIDSYFENGLHSVTATYNLLNNGQVRVLNVGHLKDGSTKTIIGNARLCSDNNSVLLVSFFPFIEARYVVLYVDVDYTTAIVGSPDRSFLWLLTRTSLASNDQLGMLEQIALKNGYTKFQINSMIE